MFASESLPHGRSWEWWSVSTLINHANIWFINHGWFIKSLYICWKTSSMSQTPGSLAPFRPPASVPQEPKLRAPSWSPLWGQKPQMQVAMISTYACTLWYMASLYILSCSLFADVLYFQDRFSRNFGDIYRAYTSNGRCFAVSCLHVVTVIYLMHAACQYTSLLYCIRGVCIYIYVYMDTVSDFKLKFGYMVKFSGWYMPPYWPKLMRASDSWVLMHGFHHHLGDLAGKKI